MLLLDELIDFEAALQLIYAVDSLTQRASAPFTGLGLSHCRNVKNAGNHLNMPCTVGLSQLNNS